MPTIIHHLIILGIAATSTGTTGWLKTRKRTSPRGCIIQQSPFPFVMDPHMGYEGVSTKKGLGTV